jgi:tetratricopeptide (TPR) repeat protein
MQTENDLAQTYVNRANTCLSDGQYDMAISECTKAIQLEPHLYIAYLNRASAYNMKGQYDLGISDCNMAIQLEQSYGLQGCRQENPSFK